MKINTFKHGFLDLLSKNYPSKTGEIVQGGWDGGRMKVPGTPTNDERRLAMIKGAWQLPEQPDPPAGGMCQAPTSMCWAPI